MWLQIDQSLIDHRKTRKVADVLNIPRVYVAGHMLALWLWCIDNAKDGRLAGISNRMIAEVAHWPGDPDTFVNALITAVFLDNEIDGLAIHNWQRYTGKLMEQRKAHARRQADYVRRQSDQLALALSEPEEPTPLDCPSGDGQVTLTGPSTEENMTQHDMTNRREENRSMGSGEPEGRPPLREDQVMWIELARCLRIPRGTKWSDQAKGAWNRAIKELRALGARPGDIEGLCQAYEARFGKLPPSPNALVSHYPECKAEVSPARAIARPQYTRGGMNGRAIARTDGRATESIVLRPDDPADQPAAGSAVPALRGLGSLDRIPRSG